jgi:hypothetical protein
MISEIKMIKAKFETIKIMTGDVLTTEDLSSPRYLRALIDATENTYVHLNDTMCASLVMCQECAQKRDLLNEYLHLFDDIELGRVIHDVEEKVARFPESIKQIIDRINTVLVDMK